MIVSVGVVTMPVQDVLLDVQVVPTGQPYLMSYPNTYGRCRHICTTALTTIHPGKTLPKSVGGVSSGKSDICHGMP